MFPYAVLDDEIVVSYESAHSATTVVNAESKHGNHLKICIPSGMIVENFGFSTAEMESLKAFVVHDSNTIQYLSGLSVD